MRNTIIGCHRIGIVMFASSAYVQAPIRAVQSKQDIRDLVQLVPSVASGGTCIGCGILKALDVSTYAKVPM